MFFLSWRQLITRKKQTFLILLGISFGTLLYVTISGLQLGMRKYIAEQLLNNTAHILISSEERKVDPNKVTDTLYGESGMVRWVSPPSGLREEVKLQNYSGWYDLLSRDPRVVEFSPRYIAHVVLTNGKFNSAVNMVGVIPEKHIRVTKIEKYITQGNFNSLKGTNNIILGSGVAEDLGLKVDQYVRINAGKGTPKTFKVSGIFHFGNEQVDKSMAFANLLDVQVLTKNPGRVNEIAVALFDIDQSKEVANEWQIISSDKVKDWQEANQSFMEMIKVQDLTRYFITTAVLIVAAFGIYNVLTIMINQKKREIAILRAIGYGPKKIFQLILYQGLVLGMAGGALGLILGYFLCLYVGSIELNIEIGGGHTLWIAYDLSTYIIAFISANISSIIASVIPARAASKLTPMEIIRSE